MVLDQLIYLLYNSITMALVLTDIENIRHKPKDVKLGNYRTTFQEIILPAGTLLFKGVRQDLSGFFLVSDLIGNFIPGKGFCLTPVTNIFTFPFPYPCFGLMDWKTDEPAWMRLDTIMVYVLKSTTKFISMISPSIAVRGTPLSSVESSDIIRRCDKFPEYLRQCVRPPMTEEQLLSEASYDNCINPLTGTEYTGHISIGNQDSLDADKKMGGRKIRLSPPETPMGKYLLTLDPLKQNFLLKNLFVDFNGSRGFPEIVVRARQDLSETLIRPASGLIDGINYVMNELESGDLSILPYGYITENGFIGAEKMFSMLTRETLSGSPDKRKNAIEEHCQVFLRGANIYFDKRTGFYVLRDFWPSGTWYNGFLVDEYGAADEAGADSSEFIFKRPDLTPNLNRVAPVNTRKNRTVKYSSKMPYTVKSRPK